MKYIVVIPDGMADHPLEELGGKTPLEAAHTPNMDYLARRGRTGLVQTIPDGMEPGSDIGNMSLLGYDPRRCHTGRAPLEAANQSIVLGDDAVAFRCNLVTVEDGKMLDYSAGHIPTREASVLIKALNQQIVHEGVMFYPGKSYRNLLVLRVRNPKDYLNVKTYPPHDILNMAVKPYLPSKGPEAEMLLMLMEKSKSVFKDHPVNQVRLDLGENPATMIWLWGQGMRPQLKSFKEKFGLEGAIISAVDLVNGIGRLAGFDVVDVPGMTGYYDTNYLGKAQYALEALKEKDIVYIHVEAPDEAGHNGDLKEKITAIERIDRDILGTILNRYGEHDDVRILVLPDHPTPIELRTHTAEPVCFVMCGKGIPPDGSKKFDEASAKEKGLKFPNGESLLNEFTRRYMP